MFPLRLPQAVASLPSPCPILAIGHALKERDRVSFPFFRQAQQRVLTLLHNVHQPLRLWGAVLL